MEYREHQSTQLLLLGKKSHGIEENRFGWMAARGGNLVLGFGVRDDAYIVTTDVAKAYWA